MLLESLVEYFFTKALDSAVKKGLLNNLIFQLPSKGIAERYLKLTDDELLSFYRNEQRVEISLNNRSYVLPMSVVFEPTELVGSQLMCHIEKEVFKVADKYRSYIEPITQILRHDKKSFDGRVTRLSACTNNTIYLQEASYYEGVATNFSMDHKPKDHKNTLREWLHGNHGNNGSFGDFETSPLVNHIGVVCMIETIDGMIITQKRSKKVTNRGGTLSSSASGSINWNDIRTLQSPFSINKLAESTVREVNEELGVATHSMRFLGLLREYLRGGKPELYFFARVKEPFETLKDKWQDTEHKDESTDIVGYEFHSDRVCSNNENSREEFEKTVSSILDQIKKKANLTLTTGILLAAKHILHASSNNRAQLAPNNDSTKP